MLTNLWKVGQKAKYIDTEFGKTRIHNGYIKEVHDDHIIFYSELIDHGMWVEPNFNLDNLYPAYNF